MAASRMRLSSSMSRAFGWLVVIAALALAADEAHGQVPEAPAVVVQQLGEYPVGAQAEFPARVEAIEAVDVRARVQGVLEDIAFTAGERVEAGDILFRIERDQFEAGVASAHAQAARATANLTEAQAALARAEIGSDLGRQPREGHGVDQRLAEQRPAGIAVEHFSGTEETINSIDAK